MYKKTVDFIRETFDEKEKFIPLHEPRFLGNEKKYLNECIDSTFVSSVGKFVDDFEVKVKELTGSKYAIATSNGTSALHIALLLAGVKSNDLVISQSLTFIATCNAISYLNASPLFIDIDTQTLSLSPSKLDDFLLNNTTIDKHGNCIHTKSQRRISACVPMHTFGFPNKIDELIEVCNKFNIHVIEDAAESIGTNYKGQATGTFGLIGTFSFNGNKIITSGGGGAIVTNDDKLGKLAKHLTTQAKIPHPWNFEHDFIGYNYRLPNINAALAVAQLEQLNTFKENKRALAKLYKSFFDGIGYNFYTEIPEANSNYWLNVLILNNRNERDTFLEFTNKNGVMTRPVWTLMNKLKMFNDCISGDLTNSCWLEDRIVNIPSSVRVKK